MTQNEVRIVLGHFKHMFKLFVWLLLKSDWKKPFRPFFRLINWKHVEINHKAFVVTQFNMCQNCVNIVANIGNDCQYWPNIGLWTLFYIDPILVTNVHTMKFHCVNIVTMLQIDNIWLHHSLVLVYYMLWSRIIVDFNFSWLCEFNFTFHNRHGRRWKMNPDRMSIHHFMIL